MVLLFAVTLFLFSFGQLGRIAPFEIPAFGNLYEVGLFIIGIVLFWKYKFTKEVFQHPIVKPVSIFFGWLAVTLLISAFYYNTVQNSLAILYFVRLIAYHLFFLYFFYHLTTKKKQITTYSIFIVITTIFIIIFSLVQYFLYPNLGNLAYQGWDPHLYRLVGLFFDPPITASVFFLLGLFFLNSKQNKYLKIGVIITLGFLFFLTYSRGGFLALLITVIVFSVRKMKVKYLVILLCSAGLLYVFLPKNISEGLNLGRTASIRTRFIDYDKAIKIWQKNPLLGIGYNHIRAEKDRYEEFPIVEKYNPSHASSSFHSSFLIILVTSGVVGLLLYLWVLIGFARINSFALYSVVFLSVYSLTDNVLLHPFILFLLFTLICIQKGITLPSDI